MAANGDGQTRGAAPRQVPSRATDRILSLGLFRAKIGESGPAVFCCFTSVHQEAFQILMSSTGAKSGDTLAKLRIDRPRGPGRSRVNRSVGVVLVPHCCWRRLRLHWYGPKEMA